MECDKKNTEKKNTWPFWKKLKLPYFSPLPFNKTSRQFIRIDKKTLKEWNLKSNIYDEGLWMNNVFNLYSSKKKGRIHQFMDAFFHARWFQTTGNRG
jgi:hypothetical protein